MLWIWKQIFQHPSIFCNYFYICVWSWNTFSAELLEQCSVLCVECCCGWCREERGEQSGRGGCFLPLVPVLLSISGLPWTFCQTALPWCSSAWIIHPSIWLSPFPVEQGPLFVLGQQWLCFLIQKMPYRRGLYHHSCFANGEIEREKGAAYPQVMEMSSSEEQHPCPLQVLSLFPLMLVPSSKTLLWACKKRVYCKIFQNMNNLCLHAARTGLVAITGNHGLELLAVIFFDR